MIFVMYEKAHKVSIKKIDDVNRRMTASLVLNNVNGNDQRSLEMPMWKHANDLLYVDECDYKVKHQIDF